MKGVFIMKKILSAAAAFAISLSALSCQLKPVYNYDHPYAITASAEGYEEIYGSYENLEYYKYTDEYDSYVVITGCDESTTEVVIPSEIDDTPVAMIGYRAFAGNSNLISVTIPDSVYNIDGEAFAYCENLTDITFPTEIDFIGADAFDNTAWLKIKRAENPLVVVNNILIDGTTCTGTVTIPDTVTTISPYAFDNNYKVTDIIIPESVDYISYGAFIYCTGLTEITLPDGLSNIYYGTFKGCSNLETINIPKNISYFGEEAFEGTLWLENKRDENPLVIVNKCVIDGKTCAGDVEIPDNTILISDNAFEGNLDITSVTFPESVYDLGWDSLKNCPNLQEVTILNPYLNIEYANLSNYTEWDGELGDYVYYYNGTIRGYENSTAQEYAETYGITFESLGEAPENPDSDTIYYNGLYLLNYGDHMSVIGYDNSSESVEIPAEIDGIPVTYIDSYAFCDDPVITSVTIPDSVIYIGYAAFAGCRELTDITIPKSIAYIGENVFEGTPWLENKRAENPLVIVNNMVIDGKTCAGEVTVPDGISEICNGAFYNCEEMTGISIPDNVAIGAEAFVNCTGLTEITLPNGLEAIYYETFYDCSNLVTINIPESVSFFGGDAFEGTPWLDNKRAEDPLVIVNNSVIDGKMCTGAVEIPDGVVSLGEWAFYENKNITSLTLPASLYDTGIYSLSICTNLKEITILNPNFNIGNSNLSNYSEWDEESNEEIRYFNGVIRSYENCGIQYYAQNYGYKFESLGEAPVTELLLGDVNGNGIVDSTDASDVLAEYSRIQTGAETEFTDDQNLVADVNGDGIIDSSDASKILAYYADISTGKTPSWD